jgi:hypothetical protein
MTTTAPTSTLLPPPGPALLLHMAAARLRPVAEAAIARQAEDGRGPGDWANDLDNYLGGEVGVFCALMTPQLALDLCDWLDATAAQAVQQARAGGTEHAITGGFPGTAAQHILEAS